ncbi:MAG: GNAT family N-acetyltransferase [Lentisphaerae bacterium]|nr:GNAT family N-acetyltransferase [Lentisphaerota bacterium]
MSQIDVTAPGSAPLTVRLLNSFEAAESLRLEWDNLVLKSGVDVYQTFDWCRLWWKHYGERRQLHLLTCSNNDGLVGVFPAFTETLWCGPVRISAAKLIGFDFTLQLCNLPVVSEFLPEVMHHAAQYFLGGQRCDVLLLGPLSGPAARIDEIVSTGKREHGLIETSAVIGQSCNTYFHLSGTFEDYLKAIGKQQRGNYNRSLTQLAKSHRVTFDVVTQCHQLADEFEAFRSLHETQWKLEGKLGHFGDWPKSLDFYRDIVQVLGGRQMVSFHRILADDQVVSSQLCYTFGGTVYWRLPARVCGAQWDKLSFGRMGLIKMIEASMIEGRHTIEGGREHYAYKVQLGGREWPLRTVQFVRRGWGVSLRVRCFRCLASLLNLVYYKILFVRVAPRVPMLQRPLWSAWIRCTW